MNYLDQEYNSTQYPIIVTENGISSKGNGTDEDPELNDHWRADFYHGYIGQLHRAITEDKVNVFGYTGEKSHLIRWLTTILRIPLKISLFWVR